MLRFLFSARGRVSRAKFWLGLVLPQIILIPAASVSDAALAGVPMDEIATGRFAPMPWLALSAALFFLWPNIAVAAKRFHDRGLSGWWVAGFPLIALTAMLAAFPGGLSEVAATEPVAAATGVAAVAGAVLLQFMILYLNPGEEGENRFGPDPRMAGAVLAAPAPALAQATAPAPRTTPVQRVAPAPRREPPRRAAPPCKPVLSTFKGMEAFAAEALKPTPLPPGARTEFGRRGL